MPTGVITPQDLGYGSFQPLSPNVNYKTYEMTELERMSISPINVYDDGLNVYNQQFRDELRANNMSSGRKAAGALGNIIPNIAYGVAETVGLLAEGSTYLGKFAMGTLKKEELDFQNELTQFVNRNKNPIDVYWDTQNQTGSGFVNSISSGDWWVRNGAGLVESIASFALAGMGVGSLARGAAQLSVKGAAKLLKANKSISGLRRAVKVGKIADKTAQTLTAASLAYTEGAMSGAVVYDQVYNHELKRLQQDVQLGKITQAQAEEQARQKAGISASRTTGVNTAINTFLNFGALDAVFNNYSTAKKMLAGDVVTGSKTSLSKGLDIAKNANFDDYYKKIAVGSTRKNVAEAFKESLEEYVNVVSEQYGLSYGMDKGQSLLEVAGRTLGTSEAAEAMLLGAIGGAGQNILMSSVAGTEIGRNEEGGLSLKWGGAIQKEQAEALFNEYKSAIIEDIETIESLKSGQEALHTEMVRNANIWRNPNTTAERRDLIAKENARLEGERKKLEIEMLGLSTYRSITSGNTEAIVAQFEKLRDLDFDTTLAEKNPAKTKELLDEIDQIDVELAKTDIDQTQREALEKRHGEIVSQLNYMSSRTEASEYGFQSNQGYQIKSQAEEAIKHLKALQAVAEASISRDDYMKGLRKVGINKEYDVQIEGLEDIKKEYGQLLEGEAKEAFDAKIDEDIAVLKKQKQQRLKDVDKNYKKEQNKRKDLKKEAKKVTKQAKANVTPNTVAEEAQNQQAVEEQAVEKQTDDSTLDLSPETNQVPSTPDSQPTPTETTPPVPEDDTVIDLEDVSKEDEVKTDQTSLDKEFIINFDFHKATKEDIARLEGAVKEMKGNVFEFIENQFDKLYADKVKPLLEIPRHHDKLENFLNRNKEYLKVEIYKYFLIPYDPYSIPTPPQYTIEYYFDEDKYFKEFIEETNGDISEIVDQIDSIVDSEGNIDWNNLPKGNGYFKVLKAVEENKPGKTIRGTGTLEFNFLKFVRNNIDSIYNELVSYHLGVSQQYVSNLYTKAYKAEDTYDLSVSNPKLATYFDNLTAFQERLKAHYQQELYLHFIDEIYSENFYPYYLYISDYFKTYLFRQSLEQTKRTHDHFINDINKELEKYDEAQSETAKGTPPFEEAQILEEPETTNESEQGSQPSTDDALTRDEAILLVKSNFDAFVNNQPDSFYTDPAAILLDIPNWFRNENPAAMEKVNEIIKNAVKQAALKFAATSPKLSTDSEENFSEIYNDFLKSDKFDRIINDLQKYITDVAVPGVVTNGEPVNVIEDIETQEVQQEIKNEIATEVVPEVAQKNLGESGTIHARFRENSKWDGNFKVKVGQKIVIRKGHLLKNNWVFGDAPLGNVRLKEEGGKIYLAGPEQIHESGYETHKMTFKTLLQKVDSGEYDTNGLSKEQVKAIFAPYSYMDQEGNFLGFVPSIINDYTKKTSVKVIIDQNKNVAAFRTTHIQNLEQGQDLTVEVDTGVVLGEFKDNKKVFIKDFNPETNPNISVIYRSAEIEEGAIGPELIYNTANVAGEKQSLKPEMRQHLNDFINRVDYTLDGMVLLTHETYDKLPNIATIEAEPYTKEELRLIADYIEANLKKFIREGIDSEQFAPAQGKAVGGSRIPNNDLLKAFIPVADIKIRARKNDITGEFESNYETQFAKHIVSLRGKTLSRYHVFVAPNNTVFIYNPFEYEGNLVSIANMPLEDIGEVDTALREKAVSKSIKRIYPVSENAPNRESYISYFEDVIKTLKNSIIHGAPIGDDPANLRRNFSVGGSTVLKKHLKAALGADFEGDANAFYEQYIGTKFRAVEPNWSKINYTLKVVEQDEQQPQDVPPAVVLPEKEIGTEVNQEPEDDQIKQEQVEVDLELLNEMEGFMDEFNPEADPEDMDDSLYSLEDVYDNGPLEVDARAILAMSVPFEEAGGLSGEAIHKFSETFMAKALEKAYVESLKGGQDFKDVRKFVEEQIAKYSANSKKLILSLLKGEQPTVEKILKAYNDQIEIYNKSNVKKKRYMSPSRAFNLLMGSQIDRLAVYQTLNTTMVRLGSINAIKVQDMQLDANLDPVTFRKNKIAKLESSIRRTSNQIKSMRDGDLFVQHGGELIGKSEEEQKILEAEYKEKIESLRANLEELKEFRTSIDKIKDPVEFASVFIERELERLDSTLNEDPNDEGNIDVKYDDKEDTDHYFNDSQLSVNLKDKVTNRLRMFMSTLKKNDGSGESYDFNQVFNIVLNISSTVKEPTWAALRDALLEFYQESGYDDSRFGFIPQLLKAAVQGKTFILEGQKYTVPPIANELTARMNTKEISMYKVIRNFEGNYEILNENSKDLMLTVRNGITEAFEASGIFVESGKGKVVYNSDSETHPGYKFKKAIEKYNEAVEELREKINKEENDEVKDRLLKEFENLGYPLYKDAFVNLGISIAKGTFRELVLSPYYIRSINTEAKVTPKTASSINIESYIIDTLIGDNGNVFATGPYSFMSSPQIRNLIQAEAKYNNYILYSSGSFNSGGRKIYPYGNPRLLNDNLDAYQSQSTKDTGSGRSKRDHMKSQVPLTDSITAEETLFTGGSFIEDYYSGITSEKDPRDDMKLSMASLEPIKSKNADDRRGREIEKLDTARHEEYKLNLFLRSKDTITPNHRQFFLPTMSNKKVVAMLNMPYFNPESELNTDDNTYELTTEGVRDFYRYVIKPEVDRVYAFKEDSDPKETGVNSHLVYLTPWVNKHIYADGKRVNKKEAVENILREIPLFIQSIVNDQLNRWETLGLIRYDANGEVEVSKIDGILKTSNDPKKLNKIAFDYAIQYQVAYVNMFQLMIGDPANYSKFKAEENKTFLDTISDGYGDIGDGWFNKTTEETYDNIGKRLAALLAPGVVGDISFSSKLYKEKTEPLLNKGKLMIDRARIVIFNDEKIKQSPEYANILRAFKKAYKEKAKNLASSYEGMEATDAGGFITVGEYMVDALTKGTINLDQYEGFMTEWYKNPNASESDLALKHIGPDFSFGVSKPVITESFHTNILDKDGVARYVSKSMYGKMATSVLTRDLTNEFPILRSLKESMEESGISYLIPESAVKGSKFNERIDGESRVINLFTNDGINLEAINSIPKFNFSVSRKAIKEQQNIPNKTIKGNTNVVLSSQAKKLFMVNMLGYSFNTKGIQNDEMKEFVSSMFDPEIAKKFSEKGEMSGANVRLLHDLIYKKITALKSSELLDELNFNTNGKPEEGFLESISNMFVNELTKRQGDPLLKEAIKLENGEFKINPILLPGNETIQSILMSILNNGLNKVKTNGFGGTLIPDMGISSATLVTEDGETAVDINTFDKSKIINVVGKDGKPLLKDRLKYVSDGEGNVVYAQVIVPSTIYSHNGKPIDLYKYTKKDEDGRTLLDMDRIDPDVLNIFGLRIPNSGPNSNAAMEIVGFLPPSSGDGMIGPAEFTRQMGSDFDADKMFNYVKNVTEVDGRISRITSKEGSYKNQIKYYQNLLLDVYKLVASQSSDEVRALTSQPLEYGELFSERRRVNAGLRVQQLLSRLVKKGKKSTYFSLITPGYQTDKYVGGASAQAMVGIMSNAVAANGLLQGSGIYFKGEKGKPVQFDIGGLKSNSRLFERNIVGGGRTVHDVLVAYQSMALDDEKFQQLGKLNINRDTAAVIQIMALYGYSESTIQSIIMQPAVLKYLEFKNNYGYSEDLALSASFAFSVLGPDSMEQILAMSPKSLQENYSLGRTKFANSIEYNVDQLYENIAGEQDSKIDKEVLAFFRFANSLGNSFSSSIVPVTNLDSASFGKDVFVLSSRLYKFESIPANLERMDTFLSGTNIASIHESLARLASEIIENVFETGKLPAFKNNLAMDGLIDSLDPRVRNEDVRRALHKATIGVINSSPANPLFKGSVQGQRERLLTRRTIYNKKQKAYDIVKKSIGDYVWEASTIPALSSNLLLRAITVKNTDAQDIYVGDATSQRITKLTVNQADGVPKEALSRSFMDLFNSDIPLSDNEGIPYTTRNLAEDLITYSVITNFHIDSPISIVPMTFLEALGYTDFVKAEIDKFQTDWNQETFLDEFVRHNPKFLTKHDIGDLKASDLFSVRVSTNTEEFPIYIAVNDNGVLIPYKYIRTQGEDMLYERMDPKMSYPYSEYSQDGSSSFTTKYKVLKQFSVQQINKVLTNIRKQRSEDGLFRSYNILDDEVALSEEFQKGTFASNAIIQYIDKTGTTNPIYGLLKPLLADLGDVEIRRFPMGNRLARYNRHTNNIEVGRHFAKQPVDKMITILTEEIIHAQTDKIIRLAERVNRNDFNIEKLSPSIQSAVLGVRRLSEAREKMLSSLTKEQKEEYDFLKRKFSLKKMGLNAFPADVEVGNIRASSGDPIEFTEDDRNLYYPLINDYEFVAAILSNVEFAKIASNTPYSRGKSLWERIIDTIKHIINRIVDSLGLSSEQSQNYKAMAADVIELSSINKQVGDEVFEMVEDSYAEVTIPVTTLDQTTDGRRIRSFEQLIKVVPRPATVEVADPVTTIKRKYTVSHIKGTDQEDVSADIQQAESEVRELRADVVVNTPQSLQGNVRYEIFKELVKKSLSKESVERETGGKVGKGKDIAPYYIAKKGGITIEEFAENLSQLVPSLSESDIRDELISVLTDVKNKEDFEKNLGLKSEFNKTEIKEKTERINELSKEIVKLKELQASKDSRYEITDENGNEVFKENSPTRSRILIRYFQANRLGVRNVRFGADTYTIGDDSNIYSNLTGELVKDPEMIKKIMAEANYHYSIETHNNAVEEILNKIDCSR